MQLFEVLQGECCRVCGCQHQVQDIVLGLVLHCQLISVELIFLTPALSTQRRVELTNSEFQLTSGVVELQCMRVVNEHCNYQDSFLLRFIMAYR